MRDCASRNLILRGEIAWPFEITHAKSFLRGKTRFQRFSARILNCEAVVFCEAQRSSFRLIDFARSNILRTRDHSGSQNSRRKLPRRDGNKGDAVAADSHSNPTACSVDIICPWKDYNHISDPGSITAVGSGTQQYDIVQSRVPKLSRVSGGEESRSLVMTYATLNNAIGYICSTRISLSLLCEVGNYVVFDRLWIVSSIER